MRNMKKRTALLMVCVMLLCLLTACTESKAPTPDNIGAGATDDPALTAVRESLIKPSETTDLGDITAMEVYVDGERIAGDTVDTSKDVKKLYYTESGKRAVHYVDGFMLDLPSDWVADYSLSLRSRYDSEEVSLIATREDYGITYHHSTQAYLNDTYKVLKNAEFQANNGVTELDEQTITVDGWTTEVYRVKLENCKDGVKCYYTYVDYYDNLGHTVHMMIKCVDDRDFTDVITSFKTIAQKGEAGDNWTYQQGNNPHWNETTTAYYENLMKQDHCDWGIFSYKMQTTGWKVNIPLLEKKIDYEFPIISEYSHFGGMEKIGGELKASDFPNAFCDKAEKDGRMMQVTYQYTVNNNSSLTFYNPIFDIYRETDEAIDILTNYAEGAAKMDKPFFFRLNNEMNTDWTSYCGIANMLDPDIFVETWITLYDIFTQTGANEHAMWVFNGFDTSFPPFRWCDYRCYMPDAQYVDLIGLTGYNMAHGYWHTFRKLYDDIAEEYNQYFSEWPWIISEFGCSVKDGCSKADWVTDMFDCFEENRFPNIKVAVWFNCNDYVNGQVTNELVIDKDPDVIAAFKDGLARTQP